MPLIIFWAAESITCVVFIFITLHRSYLSGGILVAWMFFALVGVLNLERVVKSFADDVEKQQRKYQ